MTGGRRPPGVESDRRASARALPRRLQEPAAKARSRAERTVAGHAAQRFLEDGLTERAAGLAFYALFSLIPIVLIVAAGFSLLGDSADVAEAVQEARESGASNAISSVLGEMLGTALRAAPPEASTAGLVSLGLLFYGASKVFTDAGRALDEIAHRGRWPRSLARRVEDLAWTALLIVLGLLAIVLIFVTGRLVDGVLSELGLPDSGAIWNLLRWPAAVLVVLAMVAVVGWAAPATGRGRFRPFTPGSLVTVGLGLAASAGYAFYLGHFAHYNATYGAFAAIVILMLWVWYLCLAFLYGAEIDAVLAERTRSPQEGDDRSPARVGSSR